MSEHGNQMQTAISGDQRAGLSARERMLLSSVALDTPGKLLVCVRSRMRIDAGRWWRKTPLWIGLTDSELILFAVARRRYMERVPLADCAESRYLPISGELLLAPAEGLRFKRIAISLGDAVHILRCLHVQTGDSLGNDPTGLAPVVKEVGGKCESPFLSTSTSTGINPVGG